MIWMVANDPPLYAVTSLLEALGYRRPVSDPRRILIYKVDHLGDVLMSTPGLRAIRRRFPEAEIRVVVGEWSRGVLEHNPNIDRIVVYNSPRYTRGGFECHTLREVRNSLGDWKPDLVIGLRDDWRTIGASVFDRTARVDRGRAQLREWIARRRSPRDKRHEIDLIWEALAPLGIEPAEVDRLDYYVSGEERTWAAGLVQEKGLALPFAVFHPGASTRFKEWPLERFARVAREVSGNGRMRVVLIGSPDEVGRAGGLAELLPDLDPLDLSGQMSLRRTAALLEHASLYVGADGGMMHIATALGVPTVGLFGPGHFRTFHPVGRNVEAISRLFPCSPCSQQSCIRPHDNCMAAITVEEVLERTDALLGRSG